MYRLGGTGVDANIYVKRYAHHQKALVFLSSFLSLDLDFDQHLSLLIGVYLVHFEQKSTEIKPKRNISSMFLVPLGLVRLEVCVPPLG